MFKPAPVSISQILWLVSFLFYLLTAQQGRGEPAVTVTYGSFVSGSEGVFFADSAKVGFDASSVGVIAVGYFSSGFDVEMEADRLVASNLTTFLGNFNKLGSSDFSLAPSPGFLVSEAQFNEQSIGSTPYILTLADVSSYNDSAGASEIGLFTDSGFAGLPEGGDPIPSVYDLATTLTYDKILLGSEIPRETFVNGKAYASLELPDLPAIWGGAQELGGGWHHLSWFGSFYLDAATSWVFHQHLGWIYPSGTNPDGFWVWRDNWNSWAYIGTDIFPRFWLDNDQKWVWLELSASGSAHFLYDYSSGEWKTLDSDA